MKPFEYILHVKLNLHQPWVYVNITKSATSEWMKTTKETMFLWAGMRDSILFGIFWVGMDNSHTFLHSDVKKALMK